jgi:hypothetical protein
MKTNFLPCDLICLKPPYLSRGHPDDNLTGIIISKNESLFFQILWTRADGSCEFDIIPEHEMNIFYQKVR